MKIYSNQTLNAEHVIPFPGDVHTTEQDWWMVYDADTKIIAVEPLQCSGYTSSHLTMVVADTKQELEQYIQDHDLIANA
ncbi:MAG: hypothetical protein EBU90_22245 [Proteobacteria bacterium]|nr:hypothetical protein [Pseudomonadota bacterium]NBP15607.1 hypothetical protein [bacterium]